VAHVKTVPEGNAVAVPPGGVVHRNGGRIAAADRAARPIFVVVGMHRSGGVLLAKLLQLLGVDMASTDDAATTGWSRSEIAGFNDRLLAVAGRPLASDAHALPLPAGWWGDPAIAAIRREMRHYLGRALDDNPGPWGFKDERATRLLPFYHQLFQDMGLAPVYLWAVRSPGDCANAAVSSGLAPTQALAEIMWFIYNAEAQKFIGGDVAAVVDYAQWREQPDAMLDRLLEVLPVDWRGSRAEILECMRNHLVEEDDTAATTPMASPLVDGFYQSIRDPAQSEASVRHRAAASQAMDIVRSLIAPFAQLMGPPADASSPLPAETEAALRREIAQRTSENRWLQQQFAEQKSALVAAEAQRPPSGDGRDEVQRLHAEIDLRAAEVRAARLEVDELNQALEKSRRQAKLDTQQLQDALQLQNAANERYLARIYELKSRIGAPGAEG
jgi:hypothetical protein